MQKEILDAFAEELEKVAVGGALRWLGKNTLVRTGIGGVVGGGIGAATSDDKEKGFARGALAGALGGLASPLAWKQGRRAFAEGAKKWGKAQWSGLTGKGAKSADDSIPGVVKGLATKPIETVRKGWNRGGTMSKALTGLAVASEVPNIANKNTEEGYAEKGLGALTRNAAFIAGSRLPIIPSLLLSSGAGALGGTVGRGIDRLTGSGNKQKGSVVKQPEIPKREIAQRAVLQARKEMGY
jgi:hypothetical protein